MKPLPKIILIISLSFMFFLSVNPSYALTNISACGVTLSTANEYYVLNTSINSSDTCITIGANNVTLDGAGYTINYSKTATGYGINNTLGYNFTT
ncbi:MAG: hypothetical protein KKB09_01810, partial [Nanoarchaeota archaeon]|nr:hypothetical protein [Nanoarchaeota archaeon]